MPTSIWTLTASGIFPPGSYGTKLVGCHIIDSGTSFEFTAPDLSILAKTGGILPAPPFTFPMFTYDGLEWTITVISLSSGNVSGTWSAGGQNGEFRAPAGMGLGEEEASSSANA